MRVQRLEQVAACEDHAAATNQRAYRIIIKARPPIPRS